MLKQLLPRIDKQAEAIYMEMTQRNIVEVLLVSIILPVAAVHRVCRGDAVPLCAR